MTNKAAKIAKQWLDDADAILVTASNGLSISEGLNLFANDKKLKEVLGDLVDKYHLPNLLTAFAFKYPNQLDYWQMVARVVEYYGNNYEISNYMQDIKKIIGNKSYFVWTSNIDHHFALAGLTNLFEIEGNWFEGVCSNHPAEHGVHYLASKLHEIYEKDQAGTLTEADIPNGQSWMYSIGDAAIVHCFTQNGQYYKVRLGLDKNKMKFMAFMLIQKPLLRLKLLKIMELDFYKSLQNFRMVMMVQFMYQEKINYCNYFLLNVILLNDLVLKNKIVS